MKILFLDIDGVLNTEFTKTRFTPWTGLEPRLVERFCSWMNKWQESAKPFLVLSSTWRLDGSLCQHLMENGIHYQDKTPLLSGRPRGNEIQQWLDHFLAFDPEREIQIAILDDMADMHPVGRYLVQTGSLQGLQEHHLRKVEKLLGLPT